MLARGSQDGTATGHALTGRPAPRQPSKQRGVALDARESNASLSRLIGRETELDHVTGLLCGPRAGLLGVIIRGEAGVGKTALVQAVAEAASKRGETVLTATGVQFEVDVGLAGLTQLLAPVSERMWELPEELREDLAAVLGRRDPLPDRSPRVAPAVRALLVELARAAPVLLIVDDVHWIDPATADVLGRAVRSVESAEVRLLVVARAGVRTYFDTSDFAECRLGPLSDDYAIELLINAFPAMDRRTVSRVLTESEGNPLALLELPTALQSVHRNSGTLLPTHLPLTERLQGLYSTRILSVPPATRDLLLVAALAGPDAVLPMQDWSERRRVLASAERAGLLQPDRGDGVVRFRHPLVRTTIVGLSTAADRRQAHAALAARQDDPERAAWHRAAATLLPDEEVAATLEAAAAQAMRRGDAAAAVRSLVRAADLSPDRADRARRLADAAYVGADLDADLRGAARLLADAHRIDPDGAPTLHAAMATAYIMLNGASDIATAHRVLAAALQQEGRAPRAGGDTVAEAVHLLSEICLFAAQPSLWPAYHAAAALVSWERFPVLELWRDVVVDPARRAHAVLPKLVESLRQLDEESDPVRVERVAAAGAFVDRVGLAHTALLRLVMDARDGNAVGSGILALMLLSVDDFRRGRWAQAAEWSAEGVQLARDHQLELVAWPLTFAQSLLAAGRGDEGEVRSFVDRMRAWAEPRQVGAVVRYAHHAAGLEALGRGDSETAFRELSAISPPGILPSHVGHALWVAMDLVEAAVHAGHRDAAAAHLAAMRAARLAELSPRLELVVAGATAMVAQPFDAALFDRALETPGADEWPFELARIELCYGRLLRRSRASAAARPHLTSALVAFDDLGAVAWSQRAKQELDATSPIKPRGTSNGSDARLTPQEQRVARLASRGLTNQQIALQLLISPRTVGAHLHSVYRKLAITGRAGLHRALSEERPDELVRPTSSAETP